MESRLDYRDPKWVASRLGLDKNTVYRLLQDGALPAVQVGKKWLISESRLAQYLEEQTRLKKCLNMRRARRPNTDIRTLVRNTSYWLLPSSTARRKTYFRRLVSMRVMSGPFSRPSLLPAAANPARSPS